MRISDWSSDVCSSDLRIAFVSDRAGGDNIWLMNRDGSDKRQISKEDFRLLNQPSWSPDGQFLVAKKHFTTGRSLGTGEVRSEEHTSELQSLMRSSYAVFCLKKKKNIQTSTRQINTVTV